MPRPTLPLRGLSLSAAALLVPLTALSPSVASADDPAAVFVNEIHYDNDGTDTGEAIEVAGPAGTDLSGWSLQLYNGADGEVYDTRTLSGTLGDQEGGFGTHAETYPTNGVQNGDADGLALVAPDGTVVQFLSYEGPLTAQDGAAAGMTSTDLGAAQASSTPVGSSLALTGSGTTYPDFVWATTDRSFGQPNPDQVLGDGEPGPDAGDPGDGGPDDGGPGEGDPGEATDACATEPTDEIGAVQGTSDTGSMAGETVTVEGVVVGDFQGEDELGGVYLQDVDGDGDPATSDGVFVFDPDAPALDEGDLVRVSGRVTEYFGLTQISSVTAIGACGTADLPEPTPVGLPADDAERERLEGMRVRLDEATVTEVYDLEQYGEIVVSSGGRLFQPTNDEGDDALEQQRNDLRQLVVGDASTARYPDDIPFTDLAFEDGHVVRVGDTLTSAVGVMSYGFDAYRLQPTRDPEVARTNPRPATPDEVGGDIQVGSFNVLNYFTTLSGETDAGQDPRGADTEAELERQQAKIVSAITKLDAEVVGLMEIENDADDEAALDLVAALNERAGEDRYAAVEEPDTGGGLFGSDAIKVAMIYQPEAVIPMGPATTTQDDAFDNARLPLAQRFRPAGGGKPFTVVVNHFKSKGCGGATGENDDQGDGQGCWNADRVEQAQALATFIDTLDGSDFLVIGDLNSYGAEDPIDALKAAGLVDLVDTRLTEADQYSYVYFGQSGYLDHALATPQLARRITGADIWHINADEPPLLDYNDDNPDGFYSPDAYRSSDHDPVLVGLATKPGQVRR